MVARYSIPIGKRLGSLVLLGEAPKRNKYHRRVYARCDCGNTADVALPDLRSGKTRSCGCMRTKHAHATGGIITSTYTAWRGMKARCTNPKSDSYQDYGGRGIQVCDRWMESFANFLEDMGECPAGMSIDRERNSEGYEPGNCRWATVRTQQNNRRCTVLLEYKGVTKSISEWAEEMDMSLDALYNRIRKHKWTAEKALEKPCIKRRSRSAA